MPLSTAEALRHAHKDQGYRSIPVDESMEKKFGLERQVEFFKLLREREIIEQTNAVGQSHPIQDVPVQLERHPLLDWESGHIPHGSG